MVWKKNKEMRLHTARFYTANYKVLKTHKAQTLNGPGFTFYSCYLKICLKCYSLTWSLIHTIHSSKVWNR